MTGLEGRDLKAAEEIEVRTGLYAVRMQNKPVIEPLNNSYPGDGRINVE